MTSAKLYDFSGTLKGTIELPETLFSAPVNKAVLYDSVRQYLANQRRGTSKAKGRSDVSYSTKKPYRQKGTGRARAGMRSSPIWRHGGVVFGPHPRDYHYAIPRKMKRIALVSALSDKGVHEKVVLVEGVAAGPGSARPGTTRCRYPALRTSPLPWSGWWSPRTPSPTRRSGRSGRAPG